MEEFSGLGLSEERMVFESKDVSRETFDSSDLQTSVSVVREALRNSRDLEKHIKNVVFQMTLVRESELRSSLRNVPADIAHGATEFIRGQLASLEEVIQIIDPNQQENIEE